MQKIFLVLGSLLAAMAVALGAFGAHGLRKIADAETVSIYQTGVQYQMYHAIALLIVGLLTEKIASHSLHYAGYLFVGGIVLFSGSLYLISSLKAMTKTVPAAVGIMTPVGGLLFIAGWVLLLFACLKK